MNPRPVDSLKAPSTHFCLSLTTNNLFPEFEKDCRPDVALICESFSFVQWYMVLFESEKLTKDKLSPTSMPQWQ